MPEPLVDPAVDPKAGALELDIVEVSDELFAVAEPQAEEPVEPPPSNCTLEVVLGHGVVNGLSPGGLSSVAPSGIPPEPEAEEEFEGVIPSGEVMPMPGV